MKKIIITVGLPGSGKTHFAEEYQRENYDVNLISIDQIQEYRRLYYTRLTTEQIVENCFKWYSNVNIIDGLFLNTEDVDKILNTLDKIICIQNFEIEIHYWIPDIEACLHNDNDRREKSSENTIRNRICEKPNINRLSVPDGTNISLIEHEVIRKPDWKVAAAKVTKSTSNILKSNEWNMGGTWGNCWGDKGSVEADEPEDFYQLDNYLKELCPTINFLKYKEIIKKHVKLMTRNNRDYYGGCCIYGWYECNMEDIYEDLKKDGLIMV